MQQMYVVSQSIHESDQPQTPKSKKSSKNFVKEKEQTSKWWNDKDKNPISGYELRESVRQSVSVRLSHLSISNSGQKERKAEGDSSIRNSNG